LSCTLAWKGHRKKRGKKKKGKKGGKGRGNLQPFTPCKRGEEKKKGREKREERKKGDG